MKTVDELLDAVKTRHKITSDYKLAQFLGMTDSAIRNYRHKRSLPDEVACVKIAQAIDLDGDVLAAQIQSMRARDEETKTFWKRLAVRLEAGVIHAAVMMALAIISIAGYAPNAEATALNTDKASVQSVYYVKQLTLLIRRLTRRARRTVARFAQGIHHVQSADTDAAYLHFA